MNLTDVLKIWLQGLLPPQMGDGGLKVENDNFMPDGINVVVPNPGRSKAWKVVVSAIPGGVNSLYPGKYDNDNWSFYLHELGDFDNFQYISIDPTHPTQMSEVEDDIKKHMAKQYHRYLGKIGI